MARLKSTESAEYDAKTNTLKAKLIDDSGKPVELIFDGLAFANLMGLANLKNRIAHHVQKGQDVPLLNVTGLQVGTLATGAMSLSLLVHQIGLLHFSLPPQLEQALREKLQRPMQ